MLKEAYMRMQDSNILSYKNYYTSRNTLELTIDKYIEKAGEAKLLKHEIQYNDIRKWKKIYGALLKEDGKTKVLFLDFDGTVARFTATAAETLAVHGFLPAVKMLIDKGYKVAIITGRAMEGDGGILPALKRSGADDELLNQLEIFASHGSQQRGSDTAWQVKETQEIKDLVDDMRNQYGELNKQLLDFIQQRIYEHEILNGLEITFDLKEPVGYTLHYRQVDGSKHEQVREELEKLLTEIMPEEKTQMNFQSMKNETYKPFIYRSATKSFEILPNEEITGKDLTKGAIVKIFAKKWGAKVGVAFGDDKTDLKMQKQLKDLEDAGKLLQAFVGISHGSSPREIKKQSTIVLTEQEMAVGLLLDLAKKAPYQKKLKR